MRFRDRADAGRRLADSVRALGLIDPVVLGLPRGGVPVAAEVAAGIGGVLDVFVARKVGAPGRAEYGIGAVAEGDAVVANAEALRMLRVGRAEFDRLVEGERLELARRVARYRGDRPLPVVAGRDVVLVDDGLATGVTAEAALASLRAMQPGRLVLAVPVASPPTVARLQGVANDVVCVHAPAGFAAVGQFYDDFAQMTDDEVLALL